MFGRLRQRRTAKRPSPFVLAENDLGVYCIPRKAAHRPACQAVLKGRVWEPETVRFLCEHASGDIIHGGTFFGDFLPALSRHYDHVWAFEPNRNSFMCAEVTIRLNELKNVTMSNAGMGKSRSSASLCTEQRGIYLGGASFIVEQPGDIAIEPIDTAVPQDRRIGVIHLDVEGYEHAAIEGALNTIARWRPILVLETVPEIVETLDYHQVAHINENYVFAPTNSPSP